MSEEMNDWSTRPLEELTALIRDGSHGTHQDAAEGIPLLSAKDVRDGSLALPDDCRRISEADYRLIHKSYEITEGDILLTVVGSIGRCYLLSGIEPRFTIQRSVGVIRAARIEPHYLFHYFRSEPFQRCLLELTNASAQGGVYLGSLAKSSVTFPTSKIEQTQIAQILSTVDRAIEQTEALITKQHRIKTGLMQDLLTHGIDEHGNIRSESTHSFKDSPLGRIPIEWGDGSLESVASFITSGSRGWAQYYSNEGAIFLRIGNLTRAHINLRLDDLVLVKPPSSSEGKRTSVQPGDLLISITADLGIIGMIPPDFGEAYVNQHISLIRLKSQLVNPRFVGWYLSGNGGQSQFEALNESGAKAGLNLPTVKRLMLPLPSLAEQSQVAKILDESSACANAYIEGGQKLRSLKTALMQDLLTGKKRVTSLLEAAITH